MKTVNEAKQLVLQHTGSLEKINVGVSECQGSASADDLLSPIDFPPFPQSAMDGYAICFSSVQNGEKLTVTAEVAAGALTCPLAVKPGEAVRIFTGARVPDGADTVVQQEWVDRVADMIQIKQKITKGQNIRPTGSQTRANQTVLESGTPITPGGASLLAGLGFTHLKVHRKPRISIINTGHELVKPGNTLEQGQVYESNSFALQHALSEMHIVPFEIIWVDDDKVQLQAYCSHALKNCDLVLITGGVSVGDHDHVVEALATIGVQKHFHKISQKPGKPLYFGTLGNIPAFGLPGNPASVLTAFYIYVIPVIKKMMGFRQPDLTTVLLPCLDTYTKKAGFTHFLKGKIQDNGVQILAHQESYKMNTFALADVLIEIPELQENVQKNDLVKCYLLKSL